MIFNFQCNEINKISNQLIFGFCTVSYQLLYSIQLVYYISCNFPSNSFIPSNFFIRNSRIDKLRDICTATLHRIEDVVQNSERWIEYFFWASTANLWMNIFCYECDLFTFVSGLEQSKVLRTTIAFSSTSRVFACETIANIVKRIFRILEYNEKQKCFFTLQ